MPFTIRKLNCEARLLRLWRIVSFEQCLDLGNFRTAEKLFQDQQAITTIRKKEALSHVSVYAS